jgi:U3 small nucleolar RNA-associated protein 12
MVKTYLRHGPTEVFGLVASNTSNSVWDGRKVYVPACEDVLVWETRTGTQVSMWHETGLKSLVTCISRSPVNWEQFAVGYQDGSIRLWNSSNQSVLVTFNGHKNQITSLTWDSDGTRLASGSKDTDIIVWDVIAEVGLFRLRGHRNEITGLTFISPTTTTTTSTLDDDSSPSSHLLSSSKDTFLKLFNLSTQHCIETVVGHRGEAWSFAYDKQSNVLISGGGEGEVKCWKIDNEILINGHSHQTEGGGKLKRAIRPIAALNLPHTSHSHNVSQITLHPTLPVLAIHSGEKAIDVFRLRTEEELKKKLARRRKREREKKDKGKGKGKQEQDDNDDNDNDNEDGQDGETGEVEWRDRLAIWSVVRTGGKIKSFSFAPETAKSTKGEVQVSYLTHSFISTDSN